VSLFPAIKGFQSARTKELPDSSIEVTITSLVNNSKSDTTYVIAKQIVKNLATYIEEFELCRSGSMMANWSVFDGQAAVNVPLLSSSNSPSEYEVLLKTREKYNTIFLYANDSAIVAWSMNSNYDWHNAEKNTKIFNYSDIERLTVLKTGNIWPGVGYGALVGGLVLWAGNATDNHSNQYYSFPMFILGAVWGAQFGGIVGAIMNIDIEDDINGSQLEYLKVLPEIKRRSIYSQFPPPEIQKLLAK